MNNSSRHRNVCIYVPKGEEWDSILEKLDRIAEERSAVEGRRVSRSEIFLDAAVDIVNAYERRASARLAVNSKARKKKTG